MHIARKYTDRQTWRHPTSYCLGSHQARPRQSFPGRVPMIWPSFRAIKLWHSVSEPLGRLTNTYECRNCYWPDKLQVQLWQAYWTCVTPLTCTIRPWWQIAGGIDWTSTHGECKATKVPAGDHWQIGGDIYSVGYLNVDDFSIHSTAFLDKVTLAP